CVVGGMEGVSVGEHGVTLQVLRRVTYIACTKQGICHDGGARSCTKMAQTKTPKPRANGYKGLQAWHACCCTCTLRPLFFEGGSINA
ncbi:MAG: hypothetical protein O2997_01930, partial [Proteobacteria bacterium]|nr:hypothetical protein [Pseudomonadota bacterium]